MAFAKLSPAEAYRRLSEYPEEYVLVDVREKEEFDALHARMAMSLPLQQLKGRDISDLQAKKIVCICQSGARGEKAAALFVEKGCEAYNLEGGTSAWEKAELPVIRGNSTISLERQVRIAAGGLVLIGSLAGLVVKPLLILPLFIGGGLLYSGVTNSCGMARALAKMPWNRSCT